MSKKIDKEFVRALGKDLLIDLTDAEIEYFIPFIQDNENYMDKFIEEAKKFKLTPRYFPKTINCAKLREDTPINHKEDYLSDAKKADKYVVGK